MLKVKSGATFAVELKHAEFDVDCTDAATLVPPVPKPVLSLT
jgi:hypothetical protein